MCYKALDPVFMSSYVYEHPRESLFFQCSSFFLPASLLVKLQSSDEDLSACGRHPGIHSHAKKKPSDTQGSFQVGEKKSNIFVAPLFDELLSHFLFMTCFLIFLSSWSFDGKAVWHTMWYVGSWCYCIYIVSFTVLSQFNFCKMHMASSVRPVSQILYEHRSVYFSWLCVYFSYLSQVRWRKVLCKRGQSLNVWDFPRIISFFMGVLVCNSFHK